MVCIEPVPDDEQECSDDDYVGWDDWWGGLWDDDQWKYV